MSAPQALVTGASRGIGAAIAQALAADGWRLTLAARDVAALEALRGGLPGGGHRVLPLDVADAARIAQAFESLRDDPPQALVNNAGLVETGASVRFDAARWQRVLDVDLTGAFLCTQQALRLSPPPTRIVQVASTAGLKGYAQAAAYTAAKHGLVGLTRALAIELAPAGVAVNAVCPGYTDTDLLRPGIERLARRSGRSEAEVRAEFAAVNPMKRLVRPEEVAEVVRWLCRQAPATLTGQCLALDGGETA